MTSVDDRVVEMKFDNQTFESRIAETLKSLEKLNRSLDFANSSKGLNDLTQASNRFDMSHIGTAVEGISAKFLAMSTIAITVLSNITTKVMQTAEQMIRSFTFGPIIDGFHEFETNVGSIQTILANTDRFGTTLDQVTASLDELNHYADKTIYNFGQMVSNIGLFTNAGIRIEDATSMIQGFSNVAAASGTNAQGAASAAYQLSQALSAGTIRLMDWRSLQNVGMGNKNMQQGLIELAQAMGTINKAGTSAAEIQQNFNGSLEKGWLSADVMSNFLKIMAGDMDAAQMAALGLTQAQIEGFQHQQDIAEEAATKVRTFTQLVGTIKEAIGSGWSETFRNVIGDFNESTDLFTRINNAVSGFVGHQSDARNAILKTWNDFGSRQELIDAFAAALSTVGDILKSIHNAFREVFPATTAEQLIRATHAFSEFLKSLEPSKETLSKIQNIFKAFFEVLDIGWTVLQEGVMFVGGLLQELSPAGSGVFDFADKFANTIHTIKEALIDGGGIREFFQALGRFVRDPLPYLEDLKNQIIDFFDNFTVGTFVMYYLRDAVDRVNERLDSLRAIAGRVVDAWNFVTDKLSGLRDVLDSVWNYMRDWFGDLGSRIADTFHDDDLDSAADVINVGLLGAIALGVRHFLRNTVPDLNGVVDSFKGIITGITGVLQSMQQNLQAQTIEKIAIAIGILAASILVLSLIDPGDISKALTAVGVGFAELIGAMKLMDKVLGETSTPKLAAMATTMLILASAMTILSIAVTVMSRLSWSELVRGLAGVGAGLAMLVISTQFIAQDTSGLIRAGIAMGAIAVALRLLAEAVEAFSKMSWSEIGRGMAGVAGGLVLLVGAVRLLPNDISGVGINMLLLAGAMRLMAEAVSAFSTMSWGEMGQGLLGIAGAISAIAVGLRLMPNDVGVSAAQILVISGAMIIMAKAVGDMGSIPFGQMAKGIGGLAVMLGVLAIALAAMTEGIGGAFALGIASGAILLLAKALEEIGKLPLSQIATGIGTVAALMGVLGLGALLLEPVVPALLALGVAMGAVGLAFALFGAGAYLAARAFQILAESGTQGTEVFLGALNAFGQALPVIIAGFLTGLINGVKQIVGALPELLDIVKVILSKLLDTVIELAPKIAQALVEIIDLMLNLVRDKFPDFVQTGFDMLMAFLSGIRDNIAEIVTTVADIITGFLDALALKVPEIIDSAYNLLIAVVEGVIDKLGDISSFFLPKGREIIGGLLSGIWENAANIGTFFLELPGKILEWLGDLGTWLYNHGASLILGLVTALAEKVVDVASFFIGLPLKVLEWIGNVSRTLFSKGIDLIAGIISGVTQKISDLTSWFAGLPGRVISAIGSLINTLKSTGIDLLSGLVLGVVQRAADLMTWLAGLPGRIIGAVGDLARTLWNAGLSVIQGLWDGMKHMWDSARNWLGGLAGDIISLKGPPQKDAVILVNNGMLIMQGLQNGMMSVWKTIAGWLSSLNPAEYISDPMTETMNNMVNALQDSLSGMQEFQPVITPVLDLSRIRATARNIHSMVDVAGLSAGVSVSQARTIAASSAPAEVSLESTPTAPPSVNFEQNIYSPKALTTAEIYRNTKSQIALAKEELSIA